MHQQDTPQMHQQEISAALCRTIKLCAPLKQQDKITTLIIVFFSLAHLQQVQYLLKMKIDREGADELMLVRDGEDKFYLLCRVDQSKAALDIIERAVGLAENIVAVQLSNEAEALLEKLYYNCLNKIYNFGSPKTKLILIKQSYKGRPSLLELKYYEHIRDAMIELQSLQSYLVHALRISDLRLLFGCVGVKNIPRVRLISDRYQVLREQKEGFREINEMIFREEMSMREIEKEMQKRGMERQQMQRLAWKCRQMQLYKRLIQEEKQLNELDYSKQIISELDRYIPYIAVVKNHKKWLRNSFNHLKTYFNNITNTSNTKAMQQFRFQYKQMQQNMRSLMQNQTGQNLIIFHQIKQQMDSFLQYHENVLKEKPFSSLTYLREEIVYMWKYNNRIYVKVAIFILISVIAFIQIKLINGITIFLLAVISLSLRY